MSLTGDAHARVLRAEIERQEKIMNEDERWIRDSVELFEDAERALRDEGYDHLANKIHFHISGEKELQALMDEGMPPSVELDDRGNRP